MRMRFGVSAGLYEPDLGPEASVRRAEAAERLGYETLWVGDHVAIPNQVDQEAHTKQVGGSHPGGSESQYLEPITFLSFLAGKTSMKLGTGVLIVPYRNPVVAAKSLATVDVVSGGRLIVGVGAGWMREEFEALRTPPYSERGPVTDEYLSLYMALWTQDNPAFEGQHYSVSELGFWPKPLQKPHPPIWVGGNSRAAMVRAARLGDAWMPIYLSPAEITVQTQKLREFYSANGRNPDSVNLVLCTRLRFEPFLVAGERSALTGTAQQMLDDIRRYEDAGVEEIVLLHRAGVPGDLATPDLIDLWHRFAQDVRARL
jgi:probable F420-dependent oxidoreductase